jgi:hypothetical protein
MIWLLTLCLVSPHDGGMAPSNARTIDGPTYHIQVIGAGARCDYVRPVKDATVLDAMASLPGELIPKLTKAKICVYRGASILEVDWGQIARCGSTDTNYLLFRGDRIVVEFRAPGRKGGPRLRK